MFKKQDEPDVEALTSGVFTLNQQGHLSTDPAVVTWMEAFNGVTS